jgi:hypothetical protein
VETSWDTPKPIKWAGAPTATSTPDQRGSVAVLIMATANRTQPIMNKIAANPLTITTGDYRPMESSTAGDCLAKTGARKPKFPVTAVPEKAVNKPANPSRPIPPRWDA